MSISNKERGTFPNCLLMNKTKDSSDYILLFEGETCFVMVYLVVDNKTNDPLL